MNLDFESPLYLYGINIRKEILKIIYESNVPVQIIAFFAYSPSDNEIRQLKLVVNGYSESVEDILRRMKKLSEDLGCIFISPESTGINRIISVIENTIGKKIDILRL